MYCARKKRSSWQWKGILSIWPILAKWICFKVGKGSNINFWEDSWKPNNPNFRPIPNANVTSSHYGMVDSLLVRWWNVSKLHSMFDATMVTNILKMFWVNVDEDDKLIWLSSSSRNFHVKLVYKYLLPGTCTQHNWWRFIWKCNIHERLKFFIWKLWIRGLPIRAVLVHRKWSLDNPNCPHGCGCKEDEVHFFFNCSVAKAIWLASP